MRKSIATLEFNRIFDATYDEALAFVSGKTGNIALADDILTDTYTAVYSRLRKMNAYDLQYIHEFFLDYLKHSTNEHMISSDYVVSTLTTTTDSNSISSTNLVDSILTTELSINEKDVTESLLLKKINAFVLQKDGIERKIFVLHFYCGYTLDQVSQLLEIPVYKINDQIYGLLTEIKNNFLNEYIGK